MRNNCTVAKDALRAKIQTVDRGVRPSVPPFVCRLVRSSVRVKNGFVRTHVRYGTKGL